MVSNIITEIKTYNSDHSVGYARGKFPSYTRDCAMEGFPVALRDPNKYKCTYKELKENN